MALNPKLNVYVVTLNPKDKSSNPTYRDLFKAKYFLSSHNTDSDFQKSFFQDFLNTVGKNDFRKDTKSKKVIGVSEYNAENDYSSLNLIQSLNVIEGIIDGGQYGVLRAYADVDNKNEKTALGLNKAVLDKFYVCLCTPLNSAYGFLFVQSYTESSIQEPIKNFITELMKYEDNFYAVRIESFVPKKFVEKFKQDAKIRMFTYRSKVGITDIMRDNHLLLRGQAFDVEIKITPIEDQLTPGTEQVEALASELASKQFDGVVLDEYEDKTVYVQDGKERKAHYDISKEIQSIRPTIYLADEGISVNEITGQPDFEQIKSFTLSILEEVKKEYNGYEEIEEL